MNIKAIRFVLVILLLCGSLCVACLHPATAQSNYPFYFSDSDLDPPQLLAINASGQTSSVFSSNNDGWLNGVSPDGGKIAFVRWNWQSTSANNPYTLWLGDIATGAQKSIFTGPILWSSWSPNGQFLLITELFAVTPLWAGPNYGQLILYNIATDTLTPLSNVTAYLIDWFPDSQELLLWCEGAGYFRYALEDHSAQGITFADFPDQRKLGYRWGDDMSLRTGDFAGSTALLVVNEALENEIRLYDAYTGWRGLTLTKAELQNFRPNRVLFSDDSAFLSIYFYPDAVGVWDFALRKLTVLVSFPQPSTGNFDSMRWASNSQDLYVTYGWPTIIYKITVATGQVTQVYKSPVRPGPTPSPHSVRANWNSRHF